MGIEPTALCLEGRCSTTELRPLRNHYSEAAEGRTVPKKLARIYPKLLSINNRPANLWAKC